MHNKYYSIRYLAHASNPGRRKSQYAGGFRRLNGRLNNTKEYNHDYYMKNKEKWQDNELLKEFVKQINAGGGMPKSEAEFKSMLSEFAKRKGIRSLDNADRLSGLYEKASNLYGNKGRPDVDTDWEVDRSYGDASVRKENHFEIYDYTRKGLKNISDDELNEYTNYKNPKLYVSPKAKAKANAEQRVRQTKANMSPEDLRPAAIHPTLIKKGLKDKARANMSPEDFKTGKNYSVITKPKLKSQARANMTPDDMSTNKKMPAVAKFKFKQNVANDDVRGRVMPAVEKARLKEQARANMLPEDSGSSRVKANAKARARANMNPEDMATGKRMPAVEKARLKEQTRSNMSPEDMKTGTNYPAITKPKLKSQTKANQNSEDTRSGVEYPATSKANKKQETKANMSPVDTRKNPPKTGEQIDPRKANKIIKTMEAVSQQKARVSINYAEDEHGNKYPTRLLYTSLPDPNKLTNSYNREKYIKECLEMEEVLKTGKYQGIKVDLTPEVKRQLEKIIKAEKNKNRALYD